MRISTPLMTGCLDVDGKPVSLIRLVAIQEDTVSPLAREKDNCGYSRIIFAAAPYTTSESELKAFFGTDEDVVDWRKCRFVEYIGGTLNLSIEYCEDVKEAYYARQEYEARKAKESAFQEGVNDTEAATSGNDYGNDDDVDWVVSWESIRALLGSDDIPDCLYREMALTEDEREELIAVFEKEVADWGMDIVTMRREDWLSPSWLRFYPLGSAWCPIVDVEHKGVKTIAHSVVMLPNRCSVLGLDASDPEDEIHLMMTHKPLEPGECAKTDAGKSPVYTRRAMIRTRLIGAKKENVAVEATLFLGYIHNSDSDYEWDDVFCPLTTNHEGVERLMEKAVSVVGRKSGILSIELLD